MTRIKCFVLILAVLFFNPQSLFAEIYIKVGEAQTKKSLLALPELQFIGNPSANPDHIKVGAELYKVIFNNLSVTNYFQFIDKGAFLEKPNQTAPTPAPGTPNGFKFESWSAIGADFLIRIQYSVSGESVSLETFSYSVRQAKLILGKKYSSTKSNLRKMAHKFCNELLKELTENEGMFLSKVVLSSNRSGTKGKEIYIMDWDGNNLQRVTSHNSIALSPNWAPDARKIVYTAYLKRGPRGMRNPDLLMFDLLSGQRWLVSYRVGLNSGGVFHPNGKSIYLTISESGNSDIYRIDLDGKVMQKMTNGPRGALNVEPALSPDGSKLAFSSDRSGKPMIWVMSTDGSNAQRLTYAGVYNSSPSWSPDGKKIAFAGFEKDHYDIFIMDINGSNLQRLTSARKNTGKWSSNEDPVFSPDGRHIMFTSDRSGKNQVYIINVDGSNERRITLDSFNYYKPRWSANIE